MLLCTATMSPLSHHVGHVFLVRPEKEMGRITAWRIVAAVADQKTRWYRSLCLLVRDAMGIVMLPQRSMRPVTLWQSLPHVGPAGIGPTTTIDPSHNERNGIAFCRIVLAVGRAKLHGVVQDFARWHSENRSTGLARSLDSLLLSRPSTGGRTEPCGSQLRHERCAALSAGVAMLSVHEIDLLDRSMDCRAGDVRSVARRPHYIKTHGTMRVLGEAS